MSSETQELSEQDIFDVGDFWLGFREYEMCESIFGLALVAMIFGRLSVENAKDGMSFSKKLLAILFIAFFGKFFHARISSS